MPPTTPKDTRDYYDRNADSYDRKTGFGLRGGQEYNFERYYEPLLAAELPATGRVLELGCGTGFYTRWLVDRGLDVVAMDISANMVERARERLQTRRAVRVDDGAEAFAHGLSDGHGQRHVGTRHGACAEVEPVGGFV